MLGLLFQKRLVAVAVFIPPSIVSPIQSETRSAAPRLFAIERQLLRQHTRFKRVKSVVGQDLAGQTPAGHFGWPVFFSSAGLFVPPRRATGAGCGGAATPSLGSTISYSGSALRFSGGHAARRPADRDFLEHGSGSDPD